MPDVKTWAGLWDICSGLCPSEGSFFNSRPDAVAEGAFVGKGWWERLPQSQLLIPAHLGEAAAQQHQARIPSPVQLAGQVNRVGALQIKGKQTNKQTEPKKKDKRR